MWYPINLTMLIENAMISLYNAQSGLAVLNRLMGHLMVELERKVAGRRGACGKLEKS
jgi:hypothetical protein